MPLFNDPANVACPTCSATNPLEILYGLPSQEMFDAENKGEIALGGCVIQGDDPAFLCRECGERFGTI